MVTLRIASCSFTSRICRISSFLRQFFSITPLSIAATFPLPAAKAMVQAPFAVGAKNWKNGSAYSFPMKPSSRAMLVAATPGSQITVFSEGWWRDR